MDNQHRKIKGYRELSQHEIDLMNEVKQAGIALKAILDKVDKHIDDQYEDASLRSYSADEPTSAQGIEELERLDAAQPGVWMSHAKHDLQTGLMKLTRSIAQPGFF